MKNEIIPEYINYLFDNLKEGGLKLSSSVFVDDELCDEVTQSLDKIGDEVSKILRICEWRDREESKAIVLVLQNENEKVKIDNSISKERSH